MAFTTHTLEQVINTVHHIQNATSSKEKLFVGQEGSLILTSLYANAQAIQHYSINSLLYLRTVKDKYVLLYKELITQLHIYTAAIKILTIGYLPISLITPLKLKKNLSEVRNTVWKTNPDYDLVIKRQHPYYDMKLVTFGIDDNKYLIVLFPVFIQPYTQQPLILYQIETVPVPIIDKNTQMQSDTHLQVDRPYIALNSETYITVRQQELRMCKRLGYEFYCEEFIVVKHKSKYSCENTVYFVLGLEIIKENCKSDFNYNKTGITPTVLDGGNEIILAKWPNDKHIICNINNDIPVRIPSHLYVLVNRSVLCNCGIEAENHFLLESMAACHNANPKLVMYFIMNAAFVNYLDQFTNMTESLKIPIIRNKTTSEQTLPISLDVSRFDSELLTAPRNLKDFIHQYNSRKEFFHLNERHDTAHLTTNKIFFSNNHIVDVFLFISAIISVLVTTLAIYLLYKHKKLRMLVASLALQQVKQVGAVTQEEINTECKILTCISLALTVFGLVMVAILHYRRSKLCRGPMFSNVVKVMIFVSDIQCYVPIKLCKTAGSIHLFKIEGMLNSENIKLNQNYIWDTLEIDWKEVNVTFNGNKVNLPRLIMIKLKDKFEIRHMMKKEPLLFHIMLKKELPSSQWLPTLKKLYKTI